MIIEFEEKLLEVIDARIENASDDEHYEYVDYCLVNGYIDIKTWRKLSI